MTTSAPHPPGPKLRPVTRPAAIVLAAGRGTRAGGALPKQWQDLAGRPVLAHALAAFEGFPTVLVIHPEDEARARALNHAGPIVHGGDSRDASVRAGLAALDNSGASHVLIHDGARPFASARLIRGVLAALAHHPGAAPALPIVEALWRGEAGLVQGVQDRRGLYRAQTPQGFDLAAITAAHLAHPGGAADDVEVARAFGLDVAITEGEEDNLKLTWPADFARAEAILKGRG